ncbi:MAG: nicotinate-nucleotide--dimethylbenzimidazole phosphoribosyltransferase [Burkholderiales bacterium]|nr:nicotinate-nucleotide--dimethylbenzimidazole phosphoribosyltransferase [Burkholderiales bacterium]
MSVNRSLISPTANPLLERALIDKLRRRCEAAGHLGELEPVSVRLGLMQNTLKPRFREPQLVIFAADHGLAVDGLQNPLHRETHEQVRQLLTGQVPVSVFARSQGLVLTVVDCGVANELAPHEQLMARKIAHGTRNTRIGPAMPLEQAHAAIRAGMEIGDSLPGNMVACAGLGLGSHEVSALVLSRLTDCPLRDLLVSGPQMEAEQLAHLMAITHSAQVRHRDVTDPVEAVAAFGGFEIAMMVGVMLVAASKRHLIMVDGIAACAALMVASRIAQSVTDYGVFCRSQGHLGLDQAMNLFNATALLELGLDSIDGTGSCLSWPLVKSAAALLTEVADGEDPGPSLPADILEPAAQADDAPMGKPTDFSSSY